MPKTVIKPELNNLTLGKLRDLKLEWGVSMQALFERAYELGIETAQSRKNFYIQMNKRGWRTHEPESDNLSPEPPELAAKIGQGMLDSGLTESEARQIIGVAPGHATPFLPGKQTFSLVQ